MSIALKFPDGNVKNFDDGTTVLAVAQSISSTLGKKAIAGKLDGQFVDLNAPLAHDGAIEIVTKDGDDGLAVLRNTAAFVLAAALSQLNPKMRFGEAHADEDGSTLILTRMAPKSLLMS